MQLSRAKNIKGLCICLIQITIFYCVNIVLVVYAGLFIADRLGITLSVSDIELFIRSIWYPGVGIVGNIAMANICFCAGRHSKPHQ